MEVRTYCYLLCCTLLCALLVAGPSNVHGASLSSSSRSSTARQLLQPSDLAGPAGQPPQNGGDGSQQAVDSMPPGAGTSGTAVDGSRPAAGATGAPTATPAAAAALPVDGNATGTSPSNLVEAASAAAVKVFAEHTEPDYSLPWQRQRSAASTSSGIMLSGPNGERWVLTNAHSVEYASQVQLKRRWDDRKFLARILAVGRDSDTALLTVDDPEFWQGVDFPQFGELPHPRDPVFVVGYPIGGDTVSVTAGIVSRLEVVPYTFSQEELLALQIDASINPGNSGGPVFNEHGECVGIAFQALQAEQAENIGYVVPTPVLRHFLDDFNSNKTFTGFPTLGLQLQRMESAALRAAYGMEEGAGGMLVRRVSPVGSSAGQLQVEDVLLRFEGVDVASDGTVPFRSDERIALSYLVSQKFVGDTADVNVLRDGQNITLQIKLLPPNRLVPFHHNGKLPPYALVAGLVLDTLSVPFLYSEYGRDFMKNSPVLLLEQLLYGIKNYTDEQVVVLSQVLSSDATVGYEQFSDIQTRNTQVHAFNGQPVRNLAQLAQAVVDCEEEFMRFSLDHNEVVVLETAAVANATMQVMEAHAVPSPFSRDILALLSQQGTQKGSMVEP